MNGVVILVVMVVFGAIGYAIGNGKGRGGLGLVLGGLLGLIGIIIIAVLEPAPGYMPGGRDHSRGPQDDGPRGTPAESIETRLAKLDDLKARGVLSEDEYGRERQRVLGNV